MSMTGVRLSKVKRLYHQKYRSEWENLPSFQHWLCRGADGYMAHCRICNVSILSRIASIKQHHNTRKHQKALKLAKNLLKLDEEKPSSLIMKPNKAVAMAAFVKKERMLKKPTTPKNVKNFLNEELHEDGEVEIHNSQTHSIILPSKRNFSISIKSSPTDTPTINEKTPNKISPQTHMETCSSDSMLEDLLGPEDIERESTDEIEREYIAEDGFVTETDHDLKIEELRMGDLQEDGMEEEHIINEFDLFGKSVALQLNNMELEDALLCQDRMQSVLTEFRLKIIKRQRKYHM
ncbi:uncharacterized protein LOC115631426 isoform X2 [Scaptodrosophila lebanonensis]|uniref:Uncharacterized protein LOC115631426 isoform X2 n=1 Tax=Drosophila lebanonensis TaxID=7225 RepID=A0A6J2U9Z3_DROLE|nr:uncharacterized protein LOC115631426 isoform X2 [Scaptodrosophila lebanonensis]